MLGPVPLYKLPDFNKLNVDNFYCLYIINEKKKHREVTFPRSHYYLPGCLEYSGILQLPGNFQSKIGRRMRILVNVRSDGKMNQFLYFTNLNGIMFYQKKKNNSAFYPLFIGLGCAFCCLLQEMTVNTPVIQRNRFTTITAFQKELQVTVLNNDSFVRNTFSQDLKKTVLIIIY